MSEIFSFGNKNLRGIVFCRKNDAVSTELDDETIILDVSSGVYSGLDPVGTIIWNILEEPIAFSEIVNVILATFDVSEEECTRDLIEFLKKLSEINLIVIDYEEKS